MMTEKKIKGAEKFLNILLVCIGAYGLGVLIYGLSIWLSRGSWAGIVVFASVVLLALVGALFAGPRKVRSDWGTALATTLIVAALFNAGLVARHHVLYGIYELERNEWPTQIEVVQALRAKDIEAYPSIFPYLFIGNTNSPAFLPLAGISNVTTVHCNESGKHLVYESDRYGFHNVDKVYDLPASKRIVLIGDSFTHGSCVQPGEEISGQLRLKGYSAISFGMAGNGPMLELASLMEYGPTVSPKIVIWIYFEGNDLANIARSKDHPILKKYLASKGYYQGLPDQQATIDTFLKNYAKQQEVQSIDNVGTRRADTRSRYWSFMVNQLLTFGRLRKLASIHGIDRWVPEEEIELFSHILGRAKQETKEIDATLVFVYLPTLLGAAEPSFSEKNYRSKVLNIVSEHGIEIIYMSDILHDFAVASHNSQTLAVHLTSKGYGLVAKAIHDKFLTKYFANATRQKMDQ